MPDPSPSTTSGAPIRVRRERTDPPEIEGGWALVRVEPESGNVVCQRDGRRVICPRREFELLNFPGSDDVWNVILDQNDDDLVKAKQIWAMLDLRGVSAALFRYARKLDPAFHGIQTAQDLADKVNEIETLCKKSMDLLRLEIKRARNEHERFAARTGLEYDEKDSLLSRAQELEDKYAARAYRYGTQLPVWRRLSSTLKRLEAAAKNAGTSP